jgi:transcriptional regulator with XRE-family HTH domain
MFRNDSAPLWLNGTDAAPPQSSLPREDLVGAIRRSCLEKGWDLGELARRARVSRTTLHHLLSGTTQRPHLSTLSRIAGALGLELDPDTDNRSPAGRSARRATPGSGIDNTPVFRSAARFDRATNPAIEELLHTSPDLFDEWSQEEWDELYSTFGVGGNLTPEGAADCAQAINDRRETTRQLHLVLETHLADVARRMIETLYEMVRPTSADLGTLERTERPSGTAPP